MPLKGFLSGLTFLLLLNGIVFAQTGIVDIEPAPLFPKVENGEQLKQLVYISIRANKQMPAQIRISVEEFKLAGRLDINKEWQKLDSKKSDFMFSFEKTKCRYIRIFAKNIEQNPDWHTFTGGKAWVFVDEIIVE